MCIQVLYQKVALISNYNFKYENTDHNMSSTRHNKATYSLN